MKRQEKSQTLRDMEILASVSKKKKEYEHDFYLEEEMERRRAEDERNYISRYISSRGYYNY